jgi:hypothetical protein
MYVCLSLEITSKINIGIYLNDLQIKLIFIFTQIHGVVKICDSFTSTKLNY